MHALNAHARRSYDNSVPVTSAAERFEKAFAALCAKSDRVLGVALIAQWVVLVGLALIVTPKTWIGATRAQPRT